MKRVTILILLLSFMCLFTACSSKDEAITQADTIGTVTVALGESNFQLISEGMEITTDSSDENDHKIICEYKDSGIVLEGQFTPDSEGSIETLISSTLKDISFEKNIFTTEEGKNVIITVYEDQQGDTIDIVWYQDNKGLYSITIKNDDGSVLKTVISSLENKNIISVEDETSENSDSEDKYSEALNKMLENSGAVDAQEINK